MRMDLQLIRVRRDWQNTWHDKKRVRIRGILPELTVRELKEGRLEDVHITDSTVCRILGANLRNDLTWGAHLEMGKKAILPAVRWQLWALATLKNCLSTKAKLQLVNGLVISRLAYAISLWGNTSDTVLRKAQICMNIGARFVLGCNIYNREVDLMRKCNWLNIRDLTEYYSLIQIWKAVRWDTPKYLSEQIGQGQDKWNSLPYELHTETSISKFKICLKKISQG